ncbi:excisionase family DNA-binding protein [Sphingobium sp. WCS2017Hpa-17]|uniref:excisionase family DNA-binding protein n=1 Tax=Sphingobium sp. WCS2017Hpa-17 TaxID=3073638 RepID=UPI00386B392B
MGAVQKIEKPFTVPNLADRWGCSEGLIRKMIDRGELRSFRLGVLIRVPADEVERVECQSHTPSSASLGDSPWSGKSQTESDVESGSTLKIVRARKRKLVPSGKRAPATAPAR